MTRKPRVFTIGHGDLELEDFTRLLESSSIRLIADVRSDPDGVENVHFRRALLSEFLTDRGFFYRRFGGLGGPFPGKQEDLRHSALKNELLRRYATAMNSKNFLAAVNELCGLAASTTTAVLGEQRDFRLCPRYLLSDRIVSLGLRVVHVLSADTAIEHELHPDLLIRDSEFIYQGKQLSLGW